MKTLGLIVGLIGLITAALAGGRLPVPPSAAPAPNFTSGEQRGWQVYVNKRLGFTIAYPPVWRPSDATGMAQVPAFGPTDEYGIIQERVAVDIGCLPHGVASGLALRTTTSTTVDGKSAEESVYTWASGITGLVEIDIKRPPLCLELRDGLAIDRQTFDAMVGSFRFQ